MAYPIIVIVCYILIELIKRTSLKSEWYPIISCLAGGVIAAAGFVISPVHFIAEGLAMAFMGGAVSGMAATGGNQIFKKAVKLICEKYGIEYNAVEPLADAVDDVVTK